jgi:hypothetical protein
MDGCNRTRSSKEMEQEMTQTQKTYIARNHQAIKSLVRSGDAGIAGLLAKCAASAYRQAITSDIAEIASRLPDSSSFGPRTSADKIAIAERLLEHRNGWINLYAEGGQIVG